MIRHICLFQFKDFADGRSKAENVAITKRMLDALPQTVPEIRSSKTYTAAQGQNPDNCDLMLVSEFDDFDALQRYLVHPDHVAVGAFMRPVRLSRACIDLSV